MDKRTHFIGIGGIGMSGIARLMLASGRKISGSDLAASSITRELEKQGAQIALGHNPVNVRGADKVIYSSAILPDNPEMLEAKKNKIVLMKRAQALAELMQEKTVITVAGSHGKTTTTSLVSHLLIKAGLNPTVAIGGMLKNIGNNALLGQGELFVAEADESDGSFLYYRPKYSIVTNIDREHLDYYRDFPSEVNAFKDFINQTDKHGCVFCCSDDKNLRSIIKGYKGRSMLFGLRNDPDIFARNIRMEGLSCQFDCLYNASVPGPKAAGNKKTRFIPGLRLALGGRHNISNSLAVIALGLELNIGPDVIRRAMADYKGAGRRIEIKYQDENRLVIDDYAHHPTEIKATLKAVKNLKPKKIIAIFQPHRYTRTKILFNQFAGSFGLADAVILTDIYPASELPIKGITSLRLADKLKKQLPGKTVIFAAKSDLVDRALEIFQRGSLLVTLGAGDISKICDELVERLKR